MQPFSAPGEPHDATLLALERFIQDEDLERLEDLLAEFNLFDVLGIATREVSHSAFLAWLLNPAGSHALGDYFLRRFLTVVTTEALENRVDGFPARPVDVHGWSLRDVRVVTEYPVGVGGRRVDILIDGRADRFVCLIENKVHSGESAGQLADYLTGVGRHFADRAILPVFLTPDGRGPEDEQDSAHYVPVSYQGVLNIIQRVLEMRRSIIGAPVAEFLEQYARTLGRNVLATRDNIDELAAQIYEKHRLAIEIIKNAKPDDDLLGWDIVDQVMEPYAPEIQPDYSDKNHRRFFLASLEEIPELKQGEGWTKSNRIFLLEFKRAWRNRLYLWIGPANAENQHIRQRLAECVAKLSVSGTPVKPLRPLSKHWHSTYSRNTLKQKTVDEADPERAEREITEAVKAFYEKDCYPIINAIRSEFGLGPVSLP